MKIYGLARDTVSCVHPSGKVVQGFLVF
uniref:Uncharacterized protein n=1 Tax=Rhizophora mucronata TaxID=61149 RepID=A0A2P2NJR7_RHIMU